VNILTYILIGFLYITLFAESVLNDEFIGIRYLHFGYTAFFALILILFIIFLFKDRIKALLVLPALLVVTTLFWNPWINNPAPLTEITTQNNLNFMSFSVNHRNHDYDGVAQLISDHPADVICLQEIPPSRIARFMTTLGAVLHPYQYAYLEKKSLLILSRFPIKQINSPYSFQKAVITTGKKNQQLTVWNLHSPKSLTKKHYQHRFFSELEQDIAQARTPNKLVCGDFNAAPHNDFIHKLSHHLTPAYLHSKNLLDFTFPAPGSKLGKIMPFLKIDYLFFSNSIAITHYKRLPAVTGSDHYPIIATAYMQDR